MPLLGCVSFRCRVAVPFVILISFTLYSIVSWRLTVFWRTIAQSGHSMESLAAKGDDQDTKTSRDATARARTCPAVSARGAQDLPARPPLSGLAQLKFRTATLLFFLFVLGSVALFWVAGAFAVYWLGAAALQAGAAHTAQLGLAL